MPTAAIERAVATLSPDVVLIGAMFREHAESFLADRPRFAPSAVVLGGAGFIPSDASRMSRAIVHQGAIRDVATTLDDASSARRLG